MCTGQDVQQGPRGAGRLAGTDGGVPVPLSDEDPTAAGGRAGDCGPESGAGAQGAS